MNSNDCYTRLFCALFAFYSFVKLVRLEFILILVLNVCSQHIEKRSQTTSSSDKCNDGYCSNMRSFFRAKSQLVR